jgi:hypothetical protein
MSDFVTEIRKRTLQELAGRVNAELPSGMQLRINPADLGGGGDDDDDDDDDEVDEDEDEDDLYDLELPEGMSSTAFEGSDAEKNLACAAGVYRIIGIRGLIVAQHKHGNAFCGTLSDLTDYAATNDVDIDDFNIMVEPTDILEIDASTDAMKEAMALLTQTPEYENAEDFYKKFHWGDHSKITAVREIPGVTGTLVHLGVGRRIEYGALKESKWEEYYHLFGEKTKDFPNLYAVMDADEKYPVALVIHGGRFRIEGRGLVE